MTDIELVVLDMAGTTVADDGLVVDAFTAAVGAVGVDKGGAEFERMLACVKETMGQSKIVVFRALLDGDEERAQIANAAFEARYGQLIQSGHCTPIDGAEADHSGVACGRGARSRSPRVSGGRRRMRS